MKLQPSSAGRGFSIPEILVTTGVIAVLALLAGTALPGAISAARNTQCLAKMRNLGAAVLAYAQENGGEFPRSFHSAGRMRKEPWAKAVAPYLRNGPDSTTEWNHCFNTAYRCPEDRYREANLYSYALNVFFELTPDGDDYEGAPATWSRLAAVPYASKTILLAEPRQGSSADHIMCHMWTRPNAATNAVDAQRHRKRTSNYVLVDGHVESLTVTATFDPANKINRWNPSLAGK